MTNNHIVPNIYYLSEPMGEIGLEIIDLELFRERLKKLELNPYQPHKVNYFCYLFITEGKGEHMIEFKQYPYQSDSIIFVNRNQVQAFDSNDRPQGVMINITTEFFSNSAANVRSSYFAPFHQAMATSPVLFSLPKELRNSCTVLLTELKNALVESNENDVIVQLLINALMIKLSRQRKGYLSHISEHQKERFDLFTVLVEQHFFEAREALHYAELMHTSYKNLNQLCKLCCGRTAKQLIDFRLTLEIKRKLVMDGLSIQQTAEELGFEDITNFNKYFKRQTNLTPAAFKRERGGSQ